MTDREHIEQLAAAISAEVEFNQPPRMEAANVTARRARVSRLLTWTDDDDAYVGALHELGHIALNHPSPRLTSDAGIVDQEAEAWEWALRHYRRPLSDAARTGVLESLSTYYWRTGGPTPAAQDLTYRLAT